MDDSDAPAAHGEVGEVGVATDSVADMRALVDGIGLDAVSTSMTINAPAAGALADRIEEMGGAAAAIERGFQKAEIESAAYQVAREIDEGDRIVVGVNKFAADGEEPYQPLRVDPEGAGNVLYPLRDALRADATLGEVCDALRVLWGEYRPSEM